MDLKIVEVSNKKTRTDFVNFPYQLYKNNKYWVPPIKADEKKSLLADKNPAFKFSKAKFWVAYKDEKCVGRIGGIIIQAWIEKNGKKYGRFTRPEFIDDYEVAQKLFQTVEQWLREQGMEKMHGPLGFSNLDHQGVLVEGHECLPSIGSDYHHAYYQKHYERYGFKKEIDWLEFRLTMPDSLPEKSIKVGNMILKRYKLKIVTFRSKKELSNYTHKIFDLFNDAFSELYGTYPFTDEMKQYYIDKYFPVLNPEYVKIILDDEDKLAAFIIAIPSLSKAMQKANGSLFPLGWWHIVQAFKNPIEMDLLLTGVHPKFQKMGLAAILTNKIWETGHNAGVKYVETTGMLENNHVAIQMWKSFEHIQHKRKRAYIKDL